MIVGRFQRAYVVAGCLVCVGVAAADIVAERDLILIPLFVLAPLVASIRATPRQTFGVAALAIAMAVGFGWVDDIWGSRRHSVAVGTTIVGGLLAVWIAGARQSRDRQLAASIPIIRAADRLKASLATGRMGEWSWDTTAGTVTWDANVAELFGLDRNEFGGTFDNWLMLIDERDRQQVLDNVNAAVEHRQTFRFDHRCIWPDGSVHWIEGIGEPTIDPETNRVVGGFGLAIDVDERHRQVEERTRLLEFERRQRERIEYLASINEVLARSVDLDEIVHTVTTSIIPAFADWCAIVVSIDRPRLRPSITVAHRDPDKIAWLEKLLIQYPYDVEGSWGLSAVIRTGTPELVAKVDFRRLAGVDPDVLANVDPASVITVPLVGALGTLGAMQAIRGSSVAPFSNDDLELVEEIGGRVAAALNTAILFQRQTRSRAALDTLQTVSGLIASVATTDEIVRGVLVHGGRGLSATSGAMFLADDDGTLLVKEEVGLADQVRRDAQLGTAQRSVVEESIATETVATDSGERIVAAAPLRIMNRVTGALAFTFDEDHEPTVEELSMLATLGSRCAGALERAALYERERTIALTLQHRLLSTLPTTPDWIEAAASYVPATGLEIGGDWFQILEVGDGRIAAVVGDAVGHGLASAAAMGQLRASFMTAVANDASPAHALAAVDLFAGRVEDAFAASAAYILIDESGTAHYASAGHPPIIWAPANGAATVVDVPEGGLLGTHTVGESRTISFESGDLVVMFTDGLIERRDKTIDDGLQRLVEAVEATRHLAPQQMCEAIVESLTADIAPVDDIAVLILRRT
ncbi:MAG: SpoIIE family protein phosphatase [Ilumatobacteraceae bacterium]